MERLAFVFDTRKIRFRHVAGEIVLPAKKGKEVIQFNRTPFLVAFQAGWFKFNICTVHIYYGTAQDTAQRRREIADIAAFFTTRQKKDGETYILLGDFNILNPDDPTMNSLLGSGFEVPAALRKPTALASASYYDQIALRTQNKLVEIRNAGCFRWQDYVFRDDADYGAYKPSMPTGTKTGKAAKIQDLADMADVGPSAAVDRDQNGLHRILSGQLEDGCDAPRHIRSGVRSAPGGRTGTWKLNC